MKVFCDLHHSDLYYSLQLLFEKRLGCEMYRPIGIEWYHEKYWNVFNHPATAHQYLNLEQALPCPDGLNGPMPEHTLMNKNYRFEDGIYYVKDDTKDKVQRAITLERFKEMKFDILISSMPAHITTFNQLISQFQPQAKHIFQVGNAWGHQPGVTNILSSTSPFAVPSNVNAVFYHQEFDLDVYKYLPPTSHVKTHSYIHYMKQLDLFNQYKTMLPDWQFMSYGAGMEDSLYKTQDIANTIAASGWTWHVKPGGDGYGHVLHNSYACGRPTIINASYYNGKIGSTLLEDQVTCVDISKRNTHENGQLLKQLSQPDQHAQLCERAYRRFTDIVNFDQEEQQIRKFIENLR